MNQNLQNISLLSDFTEYLAIEAGKVILPLFRNTANVENKSPSHWDPVTEADKAAEKRIRQLIEQRFPEHSILGEELGPKHTNSPYQWILDPIDGTRAFVYGMPTWTTLIGLYFENRPLLGVMYQPFVGDMFVGTAEVTYWRRGSERRTLKTGSCTRLSAAHIGTTSPHLYETSGQGPRFARLRDSAKAVRYGGDAYFFCLMAAGYLDIAMDPILQPYDIAALIPIMEGAGGHIAEWTGGNPSAGGNVIAACTRELLDEALTALQA